MPELTHGIDRGRMGSQAPQQIVQFREFFDMHLLSDRHGPAPSSPHQLAEQGSADTRRGATGRKQGLALEIAVQGILPLEAHVPSKVVKDLARQGVTQLPGELELVQITHARQPKSRAMETNPGLSPLIHQEGT